MYSMKQLKKNLIPSYYADPYNEYEESNVSIDHIFYDPNQVTLLKSGKAWNHFKERTLEDSLRKFGSDHIYVWANFNFKQHKK